MLSGADATISWEGRDSTYLAHCMSQSPEQCPVERELLKGEHSVKICSMSISMSIYLLKVLQFSWLE